MVNNLIDLSPRDYAAQPLPASLDDRVRTFVASERAADKQPQLTREAEWVLIVFAGRMASLAVRENSEAHVQSGLAALALIQGQVDLRDAIIYLSILYDAAVRIGAQADTIFKSFADAEGPMIRYIVAFPARKPEDKAISAMGFSVIEAPEGFIYRKNW
jgi:hypothetical protein